MSSLVKSHNILNWNDINQQDSSVSGCSSDAQEPNEQLFKLKLDNKNIQLFQENKQYETQKQHKQTNITKFVKESQISLQKIQDFKSSQVWLFIFAAKNVEDIIFKTLKNIQHLKMIKNQSGWNILTSRQLAIKLVKQGLKCQQNKNLTIRFNFSTMNNQPKYNTQKSSVNRLKSPVNSHQSQVNSHQSQVNSHQSQVNKYKSPNHNQKTKYIQKNKVNVLTKTQQDIVIKKKYAQKKEHCKEQIKKNLDKLQTNQNQQNQQQPLKFKVFQNQIVQINDKSSNVDLQNRNSFQLNDQTKEKILLNQFKVSNKQQNQIHNQEKVEKQKKIQNESLKQQVRQTLTQQFTQPLQKSQTQTAAEEFIQFQTEQQQKRQIQLVDNEEQELKKLKRDLQLSRKKLNKNKKKQSNNNNNKKLDQNNPFSSF